MYIADSFEGRVKVLDRSGRLLTGIGAFGNAAGELRIASDVVVDPFGRLFVANTNNARLEVYGIDSFSDPEQFAPALLDIQSTELRADVNGTLDIHFRVPGYRLSDIQQDSIRANGVQPLSVESGDFDGDARQEMRVLFDQQAMSATLPRSGRGRIVLSGLLSVLAFEGLAQIEVIPAPVLDLDQDGVADDVDKCPDTMMDSIVDARGCAIQQYCSCDDKKRHGHESKSHGHNNDYRKCIAKTAKKFQRAGLIDKNQRKQAVKDARRKDCAKPHKLGEWHKHGYEDHEYDHDDLHEPDHDNDDDHENYKHQKKHDRNMKKGDK